MAKEIDTVPLTSDQLTELFLKQFDVHREIAEANAAAAARGEDPKVFATMLAGIESFGEHGAQIVAYVSATAKAMLDVIDANNHAA